LNEAAIRLAPVAQDREERECQAVTRRAVVLDVHGPHSAIWAQERQQRADSEPQSGELAFATPLAQPRRWALLRRWR
jgi:hypothetical protein